MIIQTIALKSFYGPTGKIQIYSDNTARLIIKHGSKTLHNKIHKNKKSAMSAWYRHEG